MGHSTRKDCMYCLFLHHIWSWGINLSKLSTIGIHQSSRGIKDGACTFVCPGTIVMIVCFHSIPWKINPLLKPALSILIFVSYNSMAATVTKMAGSRSVERKILDQECRNSAHCRTDSNPYRWQRIWMINGWIWLRIYHYEQVAICRYYTLNGMGMVEWGWVEAIWQVLDSMLKVQIIRVRR